VRGEILQVLQEVGTTVVLVTHDPEEALFMADRIALMRGGVIVQAGEPAELYNRPVDPFVAGFFGGVNRLPSRVASATVPSPLGPLPAGGIAPGTRVSCLIREEAMTLRTAPVNGQVAPHAMVDATRLLGGSSLIELSMPAACGGERCRLQARVPGVSGLRPGTPVWIELDLRLVYVFPDEAA
jgi:iron(III) transport system ATP-binding protein